MFIYIHRSARDPVTPTPAPYYSHHGSPQNTQQGYLPSPPRTQEQQQMLPQQQVGVVLVDQQKICVVHLSVLVEVKHWVKLRVVTTCPWGKTKTTISTGVICSLEKAFWAVFTISMSIIFFFFLFFDAIEEFCSLSQPLLLVKLVNFVYLHPVWTDLYAACLSTDVSPTASAADAGPTAVSVSGACDVPKAST